MKRISVVLAVACVLPLAACLGGGGAKAANLIPDGAQMLGGVNLSAIWTSKLYTSNQDKLDGEAKEMMEMATACNLDPKTLSSIVIGGDAQGHYVAVLTGTGVGTEANLKCIAEKGSEKDDDFKNVTFEDKDGRRVMNMDGEAFGYFVDANTLAVAHKDWAGKLVERLDGKGTPAVEGSLKEVYGNVDTGKHVWFGGIVPADASSGVPLQSLGAVKTLAGWMDFSGGLRVNLTAGFADADGAKRASDELNGLMALAKGQIGSMGIPQGVVDSMKVEASDKNVSFGVSASEADLEAMNKTLGALAGGF